MADREDYALWLKVLATLNEAQARWYVAQKAIEWEYGGIQRAQALSGMSRVTIIKGMRELRSPEKLGVPGRVRQPGGGRKKVEDKNPSVKTVLERLLVHEIAGDPMSEQRWIRSSTRQLSEKLKEEETGRVSAAATAATTPAEPRIDTAAIYAARNRHCR